MQRWITACALAALTACSVAPQVVEISYAPPARVDPAWKSIAPLALGEVVDKRRDSTPTALGIVRIAQTRGSLNIDASEPIAALVGKSLRSGLQARGALAPDAKRMLAADVEVFEADMMIRREATVQITLTLRDEGGLPRFSKTYTSNLVEGSVSEPPGDDDSKVERVRQTAQNALRQAVDKALDDPALQAALLR